MVVLTTTTWYGGEQAVDCVYRHHIIILSQHCINIKIMVYLCELYTFSNNTAKIFASYNTYTFPCSTPCVSGFIDIQPMEFRWVQCNSPISQNFLPMRWAAWTLQISLRVITTHCRLYSNISQMLLLYKTWRYHNQFDSSKSLGVRYRCVKISQHG